MNVQNVKDLNIEAVNSDVEDLRGIRRTTLQVPTTTTRVDMTMDADITVDQRTTPWIRLNQKTTLETQLTAVMAGRSAQKDLVRMNVNVVVIGPRIVDHRHVKVDVASSL